MTASATPPVAEAVAVAAIAAVVAAPILELPSSSAPPAATTVPVAEPVPSAAPPAAASAAPPASVPGPDASLLQRQYISQRAVHTAATADNPAVLLDDHLAVEREAKTASSCTSSWRPLPPVVAVVVTPRPVVDELDPREEKKIYNKTSDYAIRCDSRRKSAANEVPINTLSLATNDNWIANITTKLTELKIPG